MKTSDLAQGKWNTLLIELGIPGRFLRNKHGECPLCGGKDRYRFDNKEGRGTYYCNNCGSGDGLSLASNYLGMPFSHVAKQVDILLKGNIRKEKIVEPDIKKIRDNLIEVGKDAREITKLDYAYKYICNRLEHDQPIIPTGIKCKDSVAYWNEGQVNQYPALIAPVMQDNKPITYHVTYLTKNGEKAPVASPKKIMTPLKKIDGGAVLLNWQEDVSCICVCEGIETGLAILNDTDFPNYPVMVALNANNMEKLRLPMTTQEVIIYPDEDESYTGQKAAYTLAHRLKSKGKEVGLITLPRLGMDYLDFYLEKKRKRKTA